MNENGAKLALDGIQLKNDMKLLMEV